MYSIIVYYVCVSVDLIGGLITLYNYLKDVHSFEIVQTKKSIYCKFLQREGEGG